MERSEVIGILESLANGLDPHTGARIPSNAYQSADTVRALFAASTLLRDTDATRDRDSVRAKKTSLAAAGKAWSTEEEAQLVAEYDSGMSTAQIGLKHGRTSGAITSRLVKLGRIDPTTVKWRERGAVEAT